MSNVEELRINHDEEPEYRILPHNLEAEQGLLGMLLIDNRHLERVSDFLRTEHFYQPPHQRIYDAILKIVDRGQNASPVTLKGFFEKDEGLSDVGGAKYLAELASEVPLMNNAKDYADTIYDLYLRRELILLGQDVVNDAHEQTVDRDAIGVIESAENKLFQLAETGQIQNGFSTLRDSVLTAIEIAEKAYQSDTHVTGTTTGLNDLDQKLGGLHDSDLLILAARPSMGKTSLAVNIGFNAARAYAESGGKEGAIVGFFSLEMSSDQLATRILADQSGISGDAIRKGNIQESDFRRFVEASQKLSQIPLYIDDTPALTIGALRTRARRLKRQHGLGLLIIDYLQLLRGSGSRQSESNRVLEISEITRGLKAIAKELQIPVLALSQLSRAVEQREDKRPMLSDLRESGSIEQDSDVVMFIFRQEYYLSREEPMRKSGEDEVKFNDRYAQWQQDLGDTANIAEVIIAKQRHGPIGIVKLFFEPNLTRFGDLDTQHHG
ncbi:MAG: replicative DNA helicase [Rhodospirillales bacterium]|nr:replicative DNA helicase [Alphaproteobacteria bacterium]USO04414.1 MAG: replicative DNA helicase [Rhodospirillales bacterium]